VTYGLDAHKEWGDNDHSQTIFFLIPIDRKEPFYIRVFDPDAVGQHDFQYEGFNTSFIFGVYGGKCYSNSNAQGVSPKGNYKSGSILKLKRFSQNTITDNKWYTFGPFNPKEGELVENYNAYIFKMIIEGENGNNGNLYRVAISENENENIDIDGGNIFTYEYTFRLKNNKGTISHITPYIGEDISEIHVNTFDFDYDGEISLYSIAKYRHLASQSGNGTWMKRIHKNESKEDNTTVDTQIVKGSTYNNDITLYLTNKYNTVIPMFSLPIGGLPVYPLSIKQESFFYD